MKRSQDEVIIISDDEKPPTKKGKARVTLSVLDDDVISISSDSDDQRGSDSKGAARLYEVRNLVLCSSQRLIQNHSSVQMKQLKTSEQLHFSEMKPSVTSKNQIC